MIQATIERDPNGRITGFFLKGHAEAAAYGKDIVCAAVSALAQTAVMGIERHLGRAITLKIADGLLDCRLKEAPDDLTEAILETMVMGLREIALQKRKYVRVIEHRR